ncbi:iron permease FTR1 family-domain-containing protein [Scheffersomyces amazonensis]|uniref:iron permease FTR1 family-domain-containing protein n=1 Tax=Scheffersomyces amazonensis TaxID=1078765 RepID=UPI00315C5597
MASQEGYFSIQIFFIILRETLETAIIISVLLSFIKQRSHSKPHPPQDTSSSVSISTSTSHSHSQIHRATHLEKVQRKLKLQVWLGAILGLFICLIIGLVFIICFYYIGKDYWFYAERIWEGTFSLLSSVVITIMGIGLLRINKVMKVKWWIKLSHSYHSNDSHGEDEEGEEEIAKLGDDDQEENQDPEENQNQNQNQNQIVSSESEISFRRASDGANGEVEESTSLINRIPLRKSSRKSLSHRHRQSFGKKYFLALLPLVTTLREGLEAVVFIGGMGMSYSPSAIAFSIVAGILVGSFIGYLLYQGGNKMSLQYFLICSTCFLYLVSAGLTSRGVWFLELERYVQLCGGVDVSETGSGPGSYDISNSIWHVNCCDGLKDGWWMVFNAILGWTNSATYGSVSSYLLYWIAVISWLEIKLYEERTGKLPLIPIKWQLKRIRKKLKLYEAFHHHNASVESNHSPESEYSEEDSEAQVLLA